MTALAIAFICGLFIGMMLGVLTLALAMMSSLSDDNLPRITVIRKEDQS